MKILQWLKMVLRRFRAQGVHYIGGSDVLPPPLSPEEEAAAVEANSVQRWLVTGFIPMWQQE